MCLLIVEKFILSGSSDKTIKVWDIENNYEVNATITAHNDTVKCLAVYKNYYLVSGSYDKSIKIWDLRKHFELKHIIYGHEDCVLSVVIKKHYIFSISGNVNISSLSKDNSIRIWNCKSKYRLVNSVKCNDSGIKAII